jgi:epoxyqueuosine reductase QueG
VCPWNVRFSKELPNDSPYAPRGVPAGKDAPAPVHDEPLVREHAAWALKRLEERWSPTAAPPRHDWLR